MHAVWSRTIALTVRALILATAALPLLAAGNASAAKLKIPAKADQLIVVSSPTTTPSGYLATLRVYRRSDPRSPWRRVFGPWRAETGYGHLRADRHEGDGSTPIGVFSIGVTIYGVRAKPSGLHYRYHRLVCGDWWDEDPESSRYNRFVHAACGTTPAFAPGSEALWQETVAYPYFAVIDFNTDPIVRGKNAPGSGIFLHSWVGGATAGCVALHQTQLLKVLRWLRPSQHPVIEIGTNAQVQLR